MWLDLLIFNSLHLNAHLPPPFSHLFNTSSTMKYEDIKKKLLYHWHKHMSFFMSFDGGWLRFSILRTLVEQEMFNWNSSFAISSHQSYTLTFLPRLCWILLLFPVLMLYECGLQCWISIMVKFSPYIFMCCVTTADHCSSLDDRQAGHGCEWNLKHNSTSEPRMPKSK